MSLHKSKIAAALIVAGVVLSVAQQASATILTDGNYDILINQNPGFFDPSINCDSGGPCNTPIVGKDGPSGSWNSNFAWGGTRPTQSSQGIFDVGPTDVNGRTTGVLDGVAGKIGITVTGGTFTVSSFQVDPTFLTVGGTFAQYAHSTAGMGGTIDQTTGAMTLDPTGRLGTWDGFANLVDEPWNVDDFTVPGATAWNIFTTGVAYSVNTGTGAATNITGHSMVANGTGGADGVLVSGGRCGSAWDTFYSCGYFETWNISVVAAPVPAAAWLLGSGLLGLIGVARHRKSA